MSVDRTEVERIAALAHLELEEREVERLTEEMNLILEHAEALRMVEPPEPSHHHPDDEHGASTRAAEAETPDALEHSPTSMAPRSADGFFVVPPPPGIGEGKAPPGIEERKAPTGSRGD